MYQIKKTGNARYLSITITDTAPRLLIEVGRIDLQKKVVYQPRGCAAHYRADKIPAFLSETDYSSFRIVK